jgi:hypothetical protein
VSLNSPYLGIAIKNIEDQNRRFDLIPAGEITAVNIDNIP